MTVQMLQTHNGDGPLRVPNAVPAPDTSADLAPTPDPALDPIADFAPDPASAPALPGNETLDGLARMAGVGRLAGEAAEAAGARDTLEELLTHEIVAGHAFAMNVLCQANNQFLGVDSRAADFDHLSRLNQATAATGLVGVRMMEVVQRGILPLDRVRHGVRYSYTVEYVGGCRARPARDCPAPGSDDPQGHAPDDTQGGA